MAGFSHVKIAQDIPTAHMVGDPVKDHGKALLMCLLNKLLQIPGASERRMDSIKGDGIVAPAALMVVLVQRHNCKGVNAQLLEMGELFHA